MRGEPVQGGARASAFTDIPLSQIERLIDEWIRSERDRYILKRRMLDGVTFERLVNELEQDPRFEQLTARQIQRIARKGVAELLKRL